MPSAILLTDPILPTIRADELAAMQEATELIALGARSDPDPLIGPESEEMLATRSNRNPPIETVSVEASPKSEAREETRSDSTPDRKGKTIRPPSENAVKSYRAWFVSEMKQSEIARQVYGDPKSQGQVSRDIKTVKKWIAAGNVLPDVGLVPPSNKKIPTKDPRSLDKGARVAKQRRDKPPS